MAEIKHVIEYIKVTDLKHYARNARTHSEAQIAQLIASIREFGFTNPVLVDENNELIAGHGRTTAAAQMGLADVPAIRLSGLTDAQKKALRLADNRLALNAAWDEELLRIELDELVSLDYDLDLMGFDEAEIEILLGDDWADAPTAPEGIQGEPQDFAPAQSSPTPEQNTAEPLNNQAPAQAAPSQPGAQEAARNPWRFGVLVSCEDEGQQFDIFDELTGRGLTCKIIAN